MNEDIIIGGQSEYCLSLVPNCRSIIELVQQAVFVRTGISSTYCEVNQVTWDITICMGRETMKVNTCCRQLGPFLHSYILGVSRFITYYTLPEITTAAKTLIGELLNTTYRDNWNEFNRLLSPPPSRQWSKEELTSVGNVYHNHSAFIDGFPSPPNDAIFFEDGEMYVVASEKCDFLYVPALWDHLNRVMSGLKDSEEICSSIDYYDGQGSMLFDVLGFNTGMDISDTWGQALAVMSNRIEETLREEGDTNHISFKDACESFEISSVGPPIYFTGDGIVVNI